MKQVKKAKMKPANLMAFVLDMIAERWKQFVLVILMGTISFGLVDLCIMLVLENQRTYLQAGELFHDNPETVYKISDANLANIWNDVQETLFQKELTESAVWSQICTFGISNVRAFEELSGNPQYAAMMTEAYDGTMEQKILAQMGRSAGDDMRVCFINQNALTLFGIHLPEPVSPMMEADNHIVSPTQQGSRGASLVPVYVGSGLKGMLEPGQVLSSAFLGLSSMKNPDGISLVSYYVAGFLEPDTLVLSDDYMGSVSIATSLNTMILICDEDARKAGYLTDTSLYGSNLYADLSTEELPAFRYEVRHLFEKYDKKLDMCTIPEDIRQNNMVEESLTLLIMLAVLLTLTGFLAFSTTSIISVLLKKRQFGIMLANGVSHRDINVMVALETAVKYLISLIIAFCFMHIMYIGNTNYLYTGIDYQMSYLHLHLQYALPLIIVLGIVGIIVSVIVPIKVVKRLDMMELLREN